MSRNARHILWSLHVSESETYTHFGKKNSHRDSTEKPLPIQLEVIRGFGWLVGFLTSSSTTKLYRGRAPRQSVWQFYVLPHMRQSWETMTSVSAGHIISLLTPTQPVGSGRPLRESNPGPPHQESYGPIWGGGGGGGIVFTSSSIKCDF